jgi:hypothetical protein
MKNQEPRKHQSPNRRAIKRTFDDLVEWCSAVCKGLMPVALVVVIASLVGAAADHARLMIRFLVVIALLVVGLFVVRFVQENRKDGDA